MAAAPAISVVLATRDRSEMLSRLLDSLRAQTVGLEAFEVVVVDDASSDDTPSVLDRARDAGDLRLTALRNDGGRGPAAARNVGWRAAAGELIVFTDDDCEADPRWLDAISEVARARPGALVQGRTEPPPSKREEIGPFSRTLEVTELGPFFQTCNIAYPRSLLSDLGGFDEGTFGKHPGGEDTDLAWRAIASGADAVFADDARVYHAVNQLGPVGSLTFPLRWSDTMAVFGRHPEMRSMLHRGIFWKRSHERLLWALLGLAAARRFPPAAIAAYPYARDVVRRARRRHSAAAAPHLAMQDVVELFAALRGAVKHRVLVI